MVIVLFFLLFKKAYDSSLDFLSPPYWYTSAYGICSINTCIQYMHGI